MVAYFTYSSDTVPRTRPLRIAGGLYCSITQASFVPAPNDIFPHFLYNVIEYCLEYSFVRIFKHFLFFWKRLPAVHLRTSPASTEKITQETRIWHMHGLMVWLMAEMPKDS